MKFVGKLADGTLLGGDNRFSGRKLLYRGKGSFQVTCPLPADGIGYDGSEVTNATWNRPANYPDKAPAYFAAGVASNTDQTNLGRWIVPGKNTYPVVVLSASPDNASLVVEPRGAGGGGIAYAFTWQFGGKITDFKDNEAPNTPRAVKFKPNLKNGTFTLTIPTPALGAKPRKFFGLMLPFSELATLRGFSVDSDVPYTLGAESLEP